MTRMLRLLAPLVAAGVLVTACKSSDTTTTTTTTAATSSSGTTAKPTGTTAKPTGTTAKPTGTTAKPTGSTPPGSATANASGVAAQVSNTALGDILVDGSGMTLYILKKDGAGTSTCSGGCATAWPPLAGGSGDRVQVGEGLDPEDFQIITRDDGTTQVTFYGHPLYHFGGDTKPGETGGQGIANQWYVIAKDGTVIETSGV